MLYHRSAVQENLRNRDGKRVFYLGKGDQLTSDARDFLTRERIPILPAQQARPERFQLLGGGFSEEKPEHMTHLNGQVLVSKTHPRIAFRGAMDTLEAAILQCAAQSQGTVRQQLEEILAYARKILGWEVLDAPVPAQPLLGLTPEQLRQHSHRPQDFYGQPHFMPAPEDGALLLAVNSARCAARHAELMAVHAFCDRDGQMTRPDLLQAMNRLSSALYLVMIRLKQADNEAK